MYISEYEYIVLKIKRCNKKVHLPFVHKIYKKLENQDPSTIYNLRKEGHKLRIRDGNYQQLIGSKKVSTKSKMNIIKKIMKFKDYEGNSLNDFISARFDHDSVRSKSMNLSNEYVFILDILATFCIADGCDLKILTNKHLKRIKKYEVCSFKDEICHISKKWFALKKLNDKELFEFEDTHRMQTKRWKRSKTYRLNQAIKNLKNYTAKWCYVDNLNIFYFNGTEYKLANIDQYKAKENIYTMDHILCIQLESGDMRYYDMNVEDISANLINKTNRKENSNVENCKD